MVQPIIVAQLGSGGMADVFLAMRRGIGGFVKLVVLKRLRTGAMEGDAVAMFHDEARISARLNHPNVVQTHEVGFDGENYRLEMEYLDGQPLHRILSRAKKAGRAIAPSVSVAVMRDVLEGLRYAHELSDYDGSPLGIVHRDVSPQNIFVTYDGSVKIVDFGIAKAAGQVAVTQLGMVKGKVRYMAPEQATGRAVDHRVDIFAAGVVLWQLLTGKSYWGDVEDIAIFHMLSRGEMPPSPRTVNPEISEGLDRVCARALAWDQEQRYATVGELIDDLTANAPEGTGARALGNLAAELFADLRQSVRTAIEKAAARPASQPEDEAETKVVSLSESSLSVADPQLTRVEGSERPVSQAVRIPEAKPTRMSRVTLLGGGLGAAVGISLLVLGLRAWQQGPATSRPTAPPAALLPAEARPAASVLALPAPLAQPKPAAGDRPEGDPKPPASSEVVATAKGRVSQGGTRVGQATDSRTTAVVVPPPDPKDHRTVDAGVVTITVTPDPKKLQLDTTDMWDAGKH